jgi:putative aldouronate transport system substrate-binding protein
VDPNTAIPEFESKLKSAGLDDIIAAKQTQLNTWQKKK